MKLSPKKRVKKKYPTAICESCGDTKQIVILLPYGKAEKIGQGRTNRIAWQEASERLP